MTPMKITPSVPETSVSEISIVLVGAFNPLIFQPLWFAGEGLVRGAEAEGAAIEIIHADASVFAMEWLSIQVLRNRFSASVKTDVYRAHLVDLVQGTFTKLSHTPIQQMGINTTLRIRMRSEADWHAFGHFLVPKAPWSGAFDRPGLQSLHIRGERDRRGWVLAQVNPDLATKSDVLFRTNEHFDVPEGKADKAEAFMQLLKEQYEPSIAATHSAVASLLDRFLAAGEVDSGDRSQ